VNTLVILGAANGALATYRTARAMGLRTIAVDQRADAPSIALADEHLALSTRDVDRLHAALSGRDDLAGVVAPASDIALPTQRELASRLGLPCGLSESAERASVDKHFFRALCDRLDIPAYRWAVGTDLADVAAAALDFRYPVVVKPADAQSGRGVTRCASPAEVDAALVDALRYSYGGSVLIEEEVAGVHCGCEAVISGGRVAFLALTERLLTPPPLAVTTGHVLPARLPAWTVERVTAIVDALCEEMDYRDGPLNLDLVVDVDGNPYVIEMGARTGGDPLGALVRRCHSVDTVEASIRTALGAPPKVSAHPARPVMVQVLNASTTGRLAGVDGLAEAHAIVGVEEIALLAAEGCEVRAGADMASKLGFAIITGASHEDVAASAAELLATLRFDIDELVGVSS
jgi:biotin carboxylase